MINNSLEWNNVEDNLKRHSKGLIHSKEVLKMIENIKHEVTELSIAEIQARRGRKGPAAEILAKVNQDIEMVEEYILVATLLG